MLTPDEHDAINRAGELYTFIADRVASHATTRETDLRELALHIHNIQHVVMAQAAARQYPQRYRLLGGPTPATKHQKGDALPSRVHD